MVHYIVWCYIPYSTLWLVTQLGCNTGAPFAPFTKFANRICLVKIQLVLYM